MNKLNQLIIFCVICTNTFAQNKINQYEYWFDNSYNTRITTNITPIKDFELISDISPNTLSDGLHIIHFRFRDSQNNYSSSISKYFMKVNPSQLLSDKKITAYEYWYDNDYQLKVFRSIVPSKEFALNTMLDVNLLSEGLHTINARFQDNGGNWSSLTTRYFYKKEKILTNNLIEAYEYWFDDQNQNRNLVAINPTKESELIVDFNTYGLTSTQPKFHIRFKDTRGNWSSVFTKTFIKTSIGSPTVYLTTKIVDPNPVLINSTGGIINDPNIAANITRTRIGAATDGVTKLLLITESQSITNFKIIKRNSNTKDGSLGSLNSPNQGVLSLNVTPINVGGKNLCFVIYTVPDSWDSVEMYDKTVEITSEIVGVQNSKTSTFIKLTNPPILLIHGLWGNKDSWTNGHFEQGLLNSGFKNVTAISYYNVSTFNPYSPSNAGIPVISAEIANSLLKYRKEGYACTQLDVIGHSMGGLMAKSYLRKGIYQNKIIGDIHKLITIGTPHKGSPLAKKLKSLPNWAINYLSAAGLVTIGDALYDLAPNSDALNSLKNINVRSHTIATRHSPNIPNDGFYKLFGVPLNPLLSYNDMSEGFENDFVVNINSQNGGLSYPQSTLFNGTIHCCASFFYKTQLESSEIRNECIRLLLSNNSIDFANNIPGISENNLDIDAFSTNSKLSLLTIKIKSPSLNQEFAKGINSKINLEIDVANSTKFHSAIYSIQDIGIIEMDSNLKSISIPLNTTVGMKKIYLVAKDTLGDILLDSTYILIKSNYEITNIKNYPDSLSFDSLSSIQNIYVNGLYIENDTTTYLNLTNENSGTIYTTSKGTSIISVFNGIVKSNNIGKDTITIRFEGTILKVPVNVTSISSPAVGVDNLTQNKIINELTNVNAYPNPFNDDVNLSFELYSKSNIEITIYNIIGRKLYSSKQTLNFGLQTISIKDMKLNDGIYFYKINSKNQSVGGKIIKISK